MLSIATILSVIFLVRCHEIDRSHAFRAHINQLKDVVNVMAVEIVDDSTELMLSDLKGLMKIELEKKYPGKKPKLSEDEEGEEKLGKLELEILTKSRLERVQNNVINIVLAVVKHCRGDKDKILGKLLGKLKGKRSKRSAGGDCLKDNPHKADLLDTLGDFEEKLLKSFKMVSNNLIKKLDLLFKSSYDFEKDFWKRENDIRELSGGRTKEAVDIIENIIGLMIHDSESIDNKGKNLDELAEKINDAIFKKDMDGAKKVKESIKKSVEKTEKLYNDVEKLVLKQHE